MRHLHSPRMFPLIREEDRACSGPGDGCGAMRGEVEETRQVGLSYDCPGQICDARHLPGTADHVSKEGAVLDHQAGLPRHACQQLACLRGQRRRVRDGGVGSSDRQDAHRLAQVGDRKADPPFELGAQLAGRFPVIPCQDLREDARGGIPGIGIEGARE